MDEWMGTSEAARALGVTNTTIYNYVERGLLVARRRPRGLRVRLEIERESVEALKAKIAAGKAE